MLSGVDTAVSKFGDNTNAAARAAAAACTSRTGSMAIKKELDKGYKSPSCRLTLAALLEQLALAIVWFFLCSTLYLYLFLGRCLFAMAFALPFQPNVCFPKPTMRAEHETFVGPT
ncbi:hypothetical protein B0I72DRAFT_128063 [Yarrowia lipolytica]|uniref:Uncharacterized protein n=1 Tax=Yarrowia lipolytica TaxID=4952 RepID=A0A371C5S6_YARLL|nr:hypothetical protein B0I71DRAFT_140863 [Yarrowia lipolytica]RDW33584.1 hypothetical protein B0I72DRAFT_128063 [Yarrowia lipolytica]RDW37522.1 hypothetical protein B0I73DRAFT_142776 [Yarrowia lipolytica]RDW47503.1 hypothetical protein B0I74DRAFT_127288 [Yarrowia lipolytica]RDW53269.1 hypothetical protein B0I75DRAFT_128049 [Yarrowia lipolytica]